MVSRENIIEEAITRIRKIFPFESYIPVESWRYHAIAETVLRYLQPGSTILDFGCGPCDVTAVLRFLGFRCSACDDLKDEWHGRSGNREKIRLFADKCGIDFRQTNGGEWEFEKNTYDMVMLTDVLEHLHNSPRDLLNDLLEFVKPAGFLFVTVPNAVNVRKRAAVVLGRTNLPRFEDYYWYPGTWRGHIREYVRHDLILLCTYLNLEILQINTCNLMLQRIPNHLFRFAYVTMMNIFPGLRDSYMLVAKKRPNWTPKNLTQNQLDKILQKSTSYRYA